MIINLTPHVVNVVNSDGMLIKSFPPSGKVARVASSQQVCGSVEGIEIVKTVFTDVQDLPQKQDGVFYLVSTIVLQALKSNGIVRDDVIAPDTSPTSVVRDDAGNIVGVKRFQVL